MPVIVSGGAYRSGSTFIHNVLLKLLRYNYIKHDAMGASQDDIDRMIQLNPKKTWVLKSHVCIPGRHESHVKYIRTKRNSYGVLRSHFYIEGIQPATVTKKQMEEACEFVRSQNAITKHYNNRPDCLVIHYDQIVTVPYFVIRLVAEHTGIPASHAIATKICEELSIENVDKHVKTLKSADPKTQWRPNHISRLKGSIDGWMESSERFLKLAQECL